MRALHEVRAGIAIQLIEQHIGGDGRGIAGIKPHANRGHIQGERVQARIALRQEEGLGLPASREIERLEAQADIAPAPPQDVGAWRQISVEGHPALAGVAPHPIREIGDEPPGSIEELQPSGKAGLRVRCERAHEEEELTLSTGSLGPGRLPGSTGRQRPDVAAACSSPPQAGQTNRSAEFVLRPPDPG